MAGKPSTFLAILALTASLLLPLTSQAEDAEAMAPTSGVARVANAAFDVLFLRTSGLAVFAVGAVMFIPAAVLATPGGNEAVDEAGDRFVRAPANYLFTRPIGEF
jgi:hypothetical protein